MAERILTTDEFLKWHDNYENFRNAGFDEVNAVYEIFRKNGFDENADVDVCYDSLSDEDKLKVSNIITEYTEALDEAVEIHDELNPKIWTEEKELIPEVRAKILQIVDKFKSQLAVDGLDLKVDDIYILGSNANYNYTNESDLDIHIIADESFDCSQEHLALLYNCYKALFNSKYNIRIKGINVELYVENKDKLTNVSAGIYSLNKGWIKNPAEYEVPEIDEIALDKQVQHWEDKYFEIMENPTVKKIDEYVDDLYKMRIESIKEGEFSLGNLTFKEIRRLGYLDDLRNKKIELTSQELSLESLDNALTESDTSTCIKHNPKYKFKHVDEVNKFLDKKNIYDYCDLGYINNVHFGVTYFDMWLNNKIKAYQLVSYHPYDDAKYHHAASNDGKKWNIVLGNKVMATETTDFEDFEKVALKVLELDKKAEIKPSMVYESLNEDADDDILIAKKCDECWDSLVSNLDEIHLYDYDKIINLQRKFERCLIDNRCDLSWRSTTSPKYGFRFGGNSSGISSSYIIHFTSDAWEKCSMTKEELIDYLKKDINTYKSGKYFDVTPISKEAFMKISFGSNTKNIGWGSQASTHVESVDLKKDKFGNLLAYHSYVIYDSLNNEGKDAINLNEASNKFIIRVIDPKNGSEKIYNYFDRLIAEDEAQQWNKKGYWSAVYQELSRYDVNSSSKETNLTEEQKANLKELLQDLD